MIPTESTPARLRRAFDESFARPPEIRDHLESFVGVGVNGDPFAIAMREIAGIVNDRRIIPLPTSVPSFSGLTTHRGVLVPIYDLGILLGHGSSISPNWVVLARARDALLGFGCDRFDGHFRTAAAEPISSPDVLYYVTGLPDARPVINVASLIESILRHPTPVTGKER